MAIRIGIDVGGTFTDLVIWEESTQQLRICKVPSTPHDPSVGLLQGLQEVQITPSAVELMIHGTTMATNAIIERKGVTCGLITTRGFRDILELRRRDRPHLYGLKAHFEPLISREKRVEVQERTTAEGIILKEVQEEEIEAVVNKLKAERVEAVVISFLHAYANPTNEQRAGRLVRACWPEVAVTLSHEIANQPGEFERTSTAVASAYVQPLMTRYVQALEAELSHRQFRGQLYFLGSDGGILTPEQVQKQAISTFLSGPAGGVVAATKLAAQEGIPHCISCDMGGTSFDVSVIRNGIPSLIDEREIAFGIPILLPLFDITTIGAGGGSIARVEKGGILRVGPESTGADPGPACYGKQLFLPTVTDAHLVLGRINPHSTLGRGGEARLNVEWAHRAIREKIAKPLGLQRVEEAAQAIIEVSNSSMAGCIELLTINKGLDPADFTLIAFGGGGPLHAAFLAQELGIKRIIVPFGAGVFSAYGCLLTELKYTASETVALPLEEVDWKRVELFFSQQQSLGEQRILAIDGRRKPVETIYILTVSYQGQSHPLALRFSIPPTREAVSARFTERYQQRYGEALAGFPLFLHALRSMTSVPSLCLPQFSPSQPPSQQGPEAALIEKRPVFWGGEWLETAVYQREKLLAGSSLDGPVVIEEQGATTVVPPGVSVTRSHRGHLHLEVKG